MKVVNNWTMLGIFLNYNQLATIWSNGLLAIICGIFETDGGITKSSLSKAKNIFSSKTINLLLHKQNEWFKLSICIFYTD